MKQSPEQRAWSGAPDHALCFTWNAENVYEPKFVDFTKPLIESYPQVEIRLETGIKQYKGIFDLPTAMMQHLANI